jgi:tetratricopeptide (TPR) repeat protein
MAETWARLELHAKRPEAAVAIIDRQLGKPGVPPLSREVLCFLKGRAYEQAGEHDRAFEAYRAANERLSANFDPADYARDIDALIESFSSEALASLPRGSDGTSLPVFIAGMPRSGTTLVEQIVDAAPGAHGAGEIKAMESIVASLPQTLGSQRPYPACIGDLTQRAADRLARRYLADIRKLDRNASVVTNKSLANYLQLGVIALLLPGARVIHCRRDPMDTCISCYCSHLMPKRLGYACDLRHVAFAYRQYERLMEHWRATLDIPMLDVCYEELIADPETVSRQMVEFCGLEWDEGCLRPHESKRFAMTLSYDQVRRPMYSSSVGRHRRFERHLGPLREALAGTST